VEGNTIVFADETHGSPLTSADISDLSEIEILDYFQSNQLGISNPTSPTGSVPHNPFILGNLLVASYYHDGVVFYDLTDPANVQEVGYYDTEPDNTNYSGYDGCWGVYPFLPSGRIIASDVLNGLFVLEMSSALINLTQPCEGTTCDDGDPSTFNDALDANCVCVGTPCPTAGTSCDDGDPNTENDMADGLCGCVGTPISECTYTTIDSNDFEGGFGIWNDGGADCFLINAVVAAYSGSYSVVLRDNSSSSVMTTTEMDMSAYEEITVDFAFIGRSMESGEDFWLQVSTDGGSSYTTVASWVSGTDFNNGRNHYFESAVISGPFTSTTLFRFRCDASANNDIIYIDDVVISGCTNNSGIVEEEEQMAAMEEVITTELIPNAENKSVSTSIEPFINLKLAPNPTRNQLNVSFFLSENSEMSLLVNDIAGKRMLTKRIKAETGSLNLELDTTDYAPGIYFITLMTVDQKVSQKFIVVE
jgi:hypothetical protein